MAEEQVPVATQDSEDVTARDLTEAASQETTEVPPIEIAPHIDVATISVESDTPVNVQQTSETTNTDVAIQDSQDTTVDNGAIQDTIDTPTEVQDSADNARDIATGDDQGLTNDVTVITDQEMTVDKQQSTDSSGGNQEAANVQSPTIVVQEAVEQGNTNGPTIVEEAITEPVDFISDLPTVQDEILTNDPTLQPSITAVEEASSTQLEEIIEEEVLDRDEIVSRCRDALAEQEKLRTQNQHLQHKLAEYLACKKVDDKLDANSKSFGDQEQRYLKCLNELESLQKKYSSVLADYQEQENELSEQCSTKQALVEQAYEECKLCKIDKSCTAINSRTGKRLNKQDMEQLEAIQKKKELELIAVRLDNIKLQYRVQKCETQLKQKEELAEGLHMIDFEQLKIDNVNLNEKIEERNEDIIKLKKKITTAVQVLTHLKQKLQFVQVDNCGKKDRLKQIEVVVAQKRDLLTRTKQARDALRIDNNSLRHKGGLVSHSTLLRDFEERRDQNDMLQVQLKELQNRHSSLILTCDGLRKKLEQAKQVQK
ncbi:cilia- and flagella-associated protein 184-like [Dysidea avara]|uniref:cilia- and flagella-associated protein 184-like n=1 Tax=Dysidea avara TaxID=196820 RepID=UPI00331CF6BE